MLRNIEITLTISLNDVVKITSPLITNTGVLCYVSFSHIHIISFPTLLEKPCPQSTFLVLQL